MPPFFEHERVVVPSDVDELGHVNNLVYMQWAINAAIDHSAANGWNFERYREIGAGWVVRTHSITYLRPAFLGDKIVVKTWIAERARATSRRIYQISRSEESGVIRLADAYTDWVFVDFARLVPRRIPPEVCDSFPVLGEDPDQSGA